MKRYLVVLALLLLAALPVRAEETVWTLRQCGASLEAIKADIAGQVREKGLIPVGIESYRGTMHILYVRNSQVGAEEWSVSVYRDVPLFMRTVEEMVGKGYTPVDVSAEADCIYVLFLRMRMRPDGWKWVVTKVDGDEIAKKVVTLIDQGYMPLGITAVSESLGWVLVHSANYTLTGRAMTSTAVKADDIRRSIDENITKGLTPFGILMGSSYMNVLYVSCAERTAAPPASSSNEPEFMLDPKEWTKE